MELKLWLLHLKKIHPITKELSHLINKDPKDGIKCLLDADILSLENILINQENIDNLTKICQDTIQKGNKIHIYVYVQVED